MGLLTQARGIHVRESGAEGMLRIQSDDDLVNTRDWFVALVPSDLLDSTLPRLVRTNPTASGRYLWFCEGKFYFTRDAELSPPDVVALVKAEQARRRREVEKAHALAAMSRIELPNENRRKPIPQEVRIEVWRRDGGRCVDCGSQHNLEFDHVIPVVMGGSNTVRNLQLLCESCNRRKGASLG